MLQQRDTKVSIKLRVVEDYLAKWRAVGRRLSALLQFVSLNMRAIRKIVKKQHKVVRHICPLCIPR
jgi:hypothetical protein